MKKKNKKLHQKQNKNRQSNTLTITLDGWMAHQNIRKKEVWVCDNKGKKVTSFMPETSLTAEQLKEYIIYSQKVIVTEEDICL